MSTDLRKREIENRLVHQLRSGHRSGVLLRAEHGKVEIPIEFLMQFAINMIRHSSADSVMLAAWSAAKEIGISRSDADVFIKEALSDKESNGTWPLGFMP